MTNKPTREEAEATLGRCERSHGKEFTASECTREHATDIMNILADAPLLARAYLAQIDALSLLQSQFDNLQRDYKEGQRQTTLINSEWKKSTDRIAELEAEVSFWINHDHATKIERDQAISERDAERERCAKIAEAEAMTYDVERYNEMNGY